MAYCKEKKCALADLRNVKSAYHIIQWIGSANRKIEKCHICGGQQILQIL
jgi:hypothetical protein